MNIKFWNQPKFKNLGGILNGRLKEGFENVWIISGVTKDTGLDQIMDSIIEARSKGTNVNICIGLDRKNTSKDMLNKLLAMQASVSVHINTEENKIETRLYVFENQIGTGNSYIYISSGKLSEDGLTANNCLVEEIEYTFEDEKLFNIFKATTLKEIISSFEVVNETDVMILAEKGEIVARITERKIPRISELFGDATKSSSIESIGNQLYDETTSTGVFEIPQNDIDIDIDIEIEGEVKKAELSTEYDARIEKEEKEDLEKIAKDRMAKFYKSTEEIQTDNKVSIIKGADELYFDNMSIFVFELNKIIEKGAGEGEIKIPTYLYGNMTHFFGAPKDMGPIKDYKGKERLGKSLSLNIIDVSNGEVYEDKNVLEYDTGKYFAIYSNIIKGLNTNEGDIVRFIKKAEGEFDVELIRKSTGEYPIWENFCKFSMKNSKRRFGIM